jgi:hypothetical protein
MEVPLNVLMWIVTSAIGVAGMVLGLMKWNDVQRDKLGRSLKGDQRESETRLVKAIDHLDAEFNERFGGLKKHLKEEYLLTKLYDNDQKHNIRRIELMEQTLLEVKGAIAILPQIQHDVHRLCVKQGIDKDN